MLPRPFVCVQDKFSLYMGLEYCPNGEATRPRQPVMGASLGPRMAALMHWVAGGGRNLSGLLWPSPHSPRSPNRREQASSTIRSGCRGGSQRQWRSSMQPRLFW